MAGITFIDKFSNLHAVVGVVLSTNDGLIQFVVGVAPSANDRLIQLVL